MESTHIEFNPLYAFALLLIEAAIFGFLGDFAYGSGGFSAMAVMTILCAMAGILALVPFVGVGLQAFAIWKWVLPIVLSTSGLTASWLTTLIILVSIVPGLAATIFTSFATIKVLGGYR